MGLYLRTGPGSVPVHLTGTSGPALKVRIKKTQHLPFARPIYHNSPIVVYFSVHLIFPTRKEAASSPLPPFSIRKQHPNLPSREGPGVCDARAQPPKNQSNHPKPRNTTSPNRSKNISTHTAPLTITHPLIPSLEGKPTRHKPLITNKKQAFRTSPLERGQGCVTPVHSYQNPKLPPEVDRHHLKNHLIPHHVPHRNTPLYPLSRGETSTSQITHYQQESSARTSPLERGRGCVTSAHSFLKSKTITNV